MYDTFSKLVEERGITVYKVAKATGISTATFSQWKKGVSTPKLDKLQKIADYFGVSIEYLMTGEELLEGIEDDLECKLVGIISSNDTKKKELLEVILQLNEEDSQKIKELALLYVEANKKG